MRFLQIYCTWILFGVGLSFPLQAQTLEWEVFVDTYYAWDIQQPWDRNRLYTTQPLRHNDFNLNLGLLQLKAQHDHFRGHLGLQTGTYVQSNLVAEPELLRSIFAANVGWHLGQNWWIDAGVFPSHIGFEGILSADNWTYSRSLIADYSPYYESGLKLSWQDEQWKGAVLLLNGWQNIQDTNHNKAVGSQLTWQPGQQFLLNWSTFVGNEAPDDQPTQWRFFNNLYAVYHLLENWRFSASLDTGLQQRSLADGFAYWWGGAVLSQYRFSEQWRLGARLEAYQDPEQVIVTTKSDNGFQIMGVSFNLDYAFHPSALARLEARILNSRDPLFATVQESMFSGVNAFLVASLSARFGGPVLQSSAVQTGSGIVEPNQPHEAIYH